MLRLLSERPEILRRFAFFALGLVVTVGALGCSSAQQRGLDDRTAVLRLAESQRRHLAVMEDELLNLHVRIEAAKVLQVEATPACLPALLKLVPGDLTYLTEIVLDTIADLGDPAALPTLERMRNAGRVYHSTVNMSLSAAIEACQPKQTSDASTPAGP